MFNSYALGHGKVLFDEFSNWAIRMQLDLEDDDDLDDDDITKMKEQRRKTSEAYLKQYEEAEKAKKNHVHYKEFNKKLMLRIYNLLPTSDSPEHKKLRKKYFKVSTISWVLYDV